MRRIGKAHGSDLPVAPRLLDDPGTGVVTVRPLGQILRKDAFRIVAPAAILKDHHETGPDEMHRDFGPRQGLLHP